MGGHYSKSQMIGIGVAFLILPIIAVALRIRAKLLTPKGICTDDYFIFGALLLALGCCTVQLIAATLGELGQHQLDGPNGQPVLNDPRFIIYERCKFATQLMAPIGLGCTKASFLFYYLQIFSVGSFRTVAHIMLGIVAAWTVSFFFSNLFTCYPITAFVEAFYGNNCVDGLAMWLAAAASDFIVDFLILAMPIPMVLRLQLPLRRKIAVSGMFLLGALVCAISVTRFVEYYKVGQEFLQHYADETYITSPVFYWTVIEDSLAVVAACLPTYGPLWARLMRSSSNADEASRMKTYARFDQTGGSRGSVRPDSHNDLSARGFDESITLDIIGWPTVQNHIFADKVNNYEGRTEDGITIEQEFVTHSQKGITGDRDHEV